MTRVVLAGAEVLDVRSGRSAMADVVIDGDRIIDVGPNLDGDDQVECSGCLLVPGFIDCHTHVCLAATMADPYGLPRSARPLSAVPALRTLLGLGITTIRDAWGADAGVRLAVERGWIEGPQILLSLRQVCTTGGIGDHWSARLGAIDGFGDPGMPDPVFSGADGARDVVRRMVRAGADWIKVAATGSMTQGRRAHDVQLTAAELGALVEEATRQGNRSVMVHAHAARAAELAARAGARSIEHGVWLDEAAVDAMKTAGTWYVPTLSVTQATNTEAAADHRRSVALALAAGVPIAMGTDSPVRPYTEALRELHYLAEAGLGAAGAFRAATTEAARLLGLADDRGEITPGKRADLVLLIGTELTTADLETRIKTIWHNGHQFPTPPT